MVFKLDKNGNESVLYSFSVERTVEILRQA